MIKSSKHASHDLNPGGFIVRHGAAVRGLIAGIVLLMPMIATAESHTDSAAATASLNATAHLNFKIVIPNDLYLNVAGAGTVAVTSTGRDVTLNATAPLPTGGLPAPIHAAAAGSIVLTAAAGKSIAQNVPCTRGDGPIVCTASMP